MNDVIETVSNITDEVKPIAPVLAGLILVVIGLMWFFAKDPQRKEMYVGWIVNVAIGFAIVYLSASLVSWLSSNIVGY